MSVQGHMAGGAASTGPQASLFDANIHFPFCPMVVPDLLSVNHRWAVSTSSVKGRFFHLNIRVKIQTQHGAAWQPRGPEVKVYRMEAREDLWL